ncbi:hypothetical protein ACFQ10_46770 [Streptomyces indonesiensis]
MDAGPAAGRDGDDRHLRRSGRRPDPGGAPAAAPPQEQCAQAEEGAARLLDAFAKVLASV